MPRDLIGETLLNQFRVETFIAAGGMATIYRVWDFQRSVPLAMKLLHPELADDPAFIARFQREALSLQTLVHPHIVPFYGLYRDGDLTFMLERYIDGPTLDEVLRANARGAGARKGGGKPGGRTMPLQAALIYFKALYTSLGYAHAQGIIHCDIKPGNVLIDRGGHVYLTDFGIARYMDSTLTTSSAMGTPLYMAPEQIRGERVSPQTDVYSLGVLMYELLTGQRPFLGEGDIPQAVGANQADRIRYQHLYAPPPDPRAANPALPEGLARVILRAMAKDPRDRYPSVQMMAEEISHVVAARFESLPDRVQIGGLARDGVVRHEDTRQPEPAPATYPGRPDPIFSDPSSSGNSLPASYEEPFEPVGGTISPQRKRNRLLAVLGLLAALSLCVFFSARLVNGIAGGRAIPPVQPPAENTPAASPAVETATAAPEASPTAEAQAEQTPTLAYEPVGLSDFPVAGEIAVIRKVDGVDRLHLLDAENGSQTALPGPPNVNVTLDNAPQWSPDGQRLTWISQYNGRLHVVAMDMQEQEPYQLPAGEAYGRVSSPDFRPGGEQITFWASGGGEIFLVTADAVTGEQVSRVSLPVYRNLFAWNPSNGLLAFVQQGAGGYTVAVSGSPGSADQMIDSGGEEYAPSWSRDGQWLAFQSDAGRGSGENEIWISRPDGREMRQVTFSPAGTWSRAPAWSPDGRQIAFVSNRSGGLGSDYGELFVVDLETEQIRQMTNTGGLIYDWRPSWRP